MNARPVILQLLPALETGGLEKGAVEIAEAIAKAGGEAVVASRPGPLLLRLRRTGAEHVPFDLASKSPLSVPRRVRTLRRLIRERNVSLVHARSRVPAWIAWLACRAEGVPLATTWHGLHEARSPFKRLYNSALARGDRVIAISGFIAARLSREYGVGPDRLRLIPRGADPAAFDPGAVSGERVQRLAEAWSVPVGARVILMPGRLSEGKGQAVLLDALSLLPSLSPRGEAWLCVMAGPGGAGRFARRLAARVEALGLRENVRFAPSCDDMPAALALAAVVVAPSLRPEPFGRVPVEAQMMGKPVIGTDQGGMTETITQGQTGVLVPPGDARALAEALAGVLDAAPEALAFLAERARAAMLARYTTRRMQSATLGVYDELLETRLREAFEECEEEDA